MYFMRGNPLLVNCLINLFLPQLRQLCPEELKNNKLDIL